MALWWEVRKELPESCRKRRTSSFANKDRTWIVWHEPGFFFDEGVVSLFLIIGVVGLCIAINAFVIV